MKRVKFEGKFPKCFDSQQQYKEWKFYARRAQGTEWPCNDCLPEFQERMKACGRCENPHVQFQKSHDGAIVGVVYLSLFQGEDYADARL